MTVTFKAVLFQSAFVNSFSILEFGSVILSDIIKLIFSTNTSCLPPVTVPK